MIEPVHLDVVWAGMDLHVRNVIVACGFVALAVLVAWFWNVIEVEELMTRPKTVSTEPIELTIEFTKVEADVFIELLKHVAAGKPPASWVFAYVAELLRELGID